MSAPLLVGISGAVQGIAVLDMLRAAGMPTHLLVSRAGALTLREELGAGLGDARGRVPLPDIAETMQARSEEGRIQVVSRLRAARRCPGRLPDRGVPTGVWRARALRFAPRGGVIDLAHRCFPKSRINAAPARR